VLVVDRYEIGERQTSACGIPTAWLYAMGLEKSLQQTFGELVIHTPWATARYRLPWTFSTFDYRSLCALLAGQGAFTFETAAVTGRTGSVVHTDRGDLRARLIVDALGWRRVLGAGDVIQPPDAFLSRGLEVHPFGTGDDLEVWIDRSYVPAGYGWSFPAGSEVRVGVGSFDPRFHVREPTERLAADLDREAVRYQGNWIPHKIRDATEDGIFFAGDSAGHCLPLTAEGIRTALYFGIAVGRQLAGVVDGRWSQAEALSRYAAFSAAHASKFESMLWVQRLIPRIAPRLLGRALRAMESRRFLDWSFGHYLNIAHPDFVARGGALGAVAGGVGAGAG
jgi:flavin-dependent dehydrogenase